MDSTFCLGDIIFILPGSWHQQILCLFNSNGNGFFVQLNVDNGRDESSENRQNCPVLYEPKTGMACPVRRLLPRPTLILLQEVAEVMIPSFSIRLRTSPEESTSLLWAFNSSAEHSKPWDEHASSQFWPTSEMYQPSRKYNNDRLHVFMYVCMYSGISENNLNLVIAETKYLYTFGFYH